MADNITSPTAKLRETLSLRKSVSIVRKSNSISMFFQKLNFKESNKKVSDTPENSQIDSNKCVVTSKNTQDTVGNQDPVLSVITEPVETVTESEKQEYTSTNSNSTTSEPKPAMAESKLTYAIKELLNTERDYVNDLAILIEKYMEAIKSNEIPMPQDMEGGKDKIVFGNIQQIYEWHKSTFSPELENCLNESSGYIGQLFVKYENRFQMYVKYCENKPKSEYIVSEYDTYFDELRVELKQKLNIQDLLIKPVQRIMKYQLMLKEIKKYMEKEGKDCKSINRAIEIMVTVPKNADDMMNVGRLQGFEGRITAQGRLLMQDTILVHEPEDIKQKKVKEIKFKERRVFLFQQIIIFSEMIGSNKKFSSPRYIFKNDMKVNKLQLSKDDSNKSFTLVDKTPESHRKFLCQCEDANSYNIWITQLQNLLDMQNEFLRNLQHPQLAMQKPSYSGNSSNTNSPNLHQPSANNSNQQHHSLTSTFNDFLKNTFNFSALSSPGSSKSTSNNNGNSVPTSTIASSQTSTNNKLPATSNNSVINPSTSVISPSLSQSSSASGSVTPSKVSNPFFAAASATSACISIVQPIIQPLVDSNHSSTANLHDHEACNSLSDDIAQIDLETSQKSQDSSNNSNIPNCARVTETYSAITEDEISVQKGDLVQIITANMHNRFLVHREANEHQPAAEGWIPGFVIGFQSTTTG